MVQLRGVAGNYLICRLEGTELLSSRTKLSPEESQARPEFRVNKIRKRFETNEQAPFEEAFDDVVPVPYGSGFALKESVCTECFTIPFYSASATSAAGLPWERGQASWRVCYRRYFLHGDCGRTAGIDSWNVFSESLHNSFPICTANSGMYERSKSITSAERRF